MTTSSQTNNEQITTLPIEAISVNPNQPRKTFCSEGIEELAASILEIGLIHPPAVRKIEGSHHYELIAGERRLRAAKLAGLKRIPVHIKESGETYSAQAALIENVQRRDLNPIEIAQALQKLIDQFSFNQKTLAKKIGKQRSTVANYLRLLSLPTPIQESLTGGFISMGHAKAILSLNTENQKNLLLENILREKMTVREAEKRANKMLNRGSQNPRGSQSQKNHILADIEERLYQQLGTKVQIQNLGEKKGRLIIDYYSWEDLDLLIKKLGLNEEE